MYEKSIRVVGFGYDWFWSDATELYGLICWDILEVEDN